MIIFLSDDAILLRERKTKEEEKDKAIVLLRSNSDSDLYHTFNVDECLLSQFITKC